MPFMGKEQILWSAELFDSFLGRLAPLRNNSAYPEPVVTAFLVHRFFDDDEGGQTFPVYPHEGVTLAQFELLVRMLRDRGFQFIHPRDIAVGALPSGPLALLTFDDGYADNLRILDILERYDAKAALFVSVAHVRDGERFWPDALWIGGHARRWPRHALFRESRRLVRLPHDQVVAFLREQFGPDALKPHSFEDRPLNEAELRSMAASPLIEIGCHAFHHTTLSPRPVDYAHAELAQAVAYIKRVCGSAPCAIAYPNGAYSGRLIRLCRDFGFEIGLTIEPRPNTKASLASPEGRMKLGRFTLSGRRNMERQVNSTQIPASLMRALYRARSHRTPDLSEAAWV
jgi:peptidoglycan/xylan/chitin deacetylase (PgdA/CDA1 family)